jgi:restriction system protein
MIPDYQTFMLPLLRLLGDEKERVFSDICEALANEFQLTPEERQELLPSGFYPTYASRIGWARTYLSKAGLLESPKRAVWRISASGLALLKRNPKSLSSKDLEVFDAFRAFKTAGKQEREAPGTPPTAATVQRNQRLESPEESLLRLHGELDAALRSELLTRIKSAPAHFFERLVVELMLKMGYGGSREDAGQVVGKSGDGGIDGVINQDRLGLDTIYLQAKRWEGTVGRPDVQTFVGSLAGHRAKRGVFITTSSYTKQAYDYVASISERVILIDGEQLATLMIEHDLGVSPLASYVVKRVDGDYFEW